MDEKNRYLGRLTDEYIQKLFTKPPYSPIMPYVGTKGKELGATDDELMDRITSRLKMEHNGTSFEVVHDARLESPYRSSYPLFGRGCRRSTNVIWLKEDRMLKCRANAIETFLSLFEDKQDPNIAEFDLSDRARGYSTRQADDYIQKFFDLEPGESIEITDHYEGGTQGNANRFLMDRICGRLENEYGVKFYVHRGTVPKLVKVES